MLEFLAGCRDSCEESLGSSVQCHSKFSATSVVYQRDGRPVIESMDLCLEALTQCTRRCLTRMGRTGNVCLRASSAPSVQLCRVVFCKDANLSRDEACPLVHQGRAVAAEMVLRLSSCAATRLVFGSVDRGLFGTSAALHRRSRRQPMPWTPTRPHPSGVSGWRAAMVAKVVFFVAGHLGASGSCGQSSNDIAG